MSGYSGNLDFMSISAEQMAAGLKRLGSISGKGAEWVKNLTTYLAGEYVGKKLPRKAKKAYIAKYGRAEYRKMYMR
ncbi:MAG: hypothetical protein Q8K92_08230 [Leadbetterella sp.]|nr:hypothetical protein [Leadbetterella sp.]